MKINEIILEQAGEPFHDILLSKGYEFIKAGADQSAYLEPGTGQVLKIFRDDGGDGSQQMAEYWINYCQKHSDNPFLPKFSGWTKFDLDSRRYMQIRMERLGDSGVRWEHGISSLSAEAFTAEQLGPARYKEHLDKVINYIISNKAQRGHKAAAPVAELMISLGEEGFEQLWYTLIDLTAIAHQHDWHIDLHAGNIMTRSNGQPVIIDPWVL